MNKNLKKILVAGASLLMLASVGANANNPIHASSVGTKINRAIKTDDLTTMEATIRNVTKIKDHNNRPKWFHGNKIEIKGKGVGETYVNGHPVLGMRKVLKIMKKSLHRRRQLRKHYKRISKRHIQKRSCKHESKMKTYNYLPKVLRGTWHDHAGGRIKLGISGINVKPNHHRGHSYDGAVWTMKSRGRMYYIKEAMDYKHDLTYGPTRLWKFRLLNHNKLYVYKQDGLHTSTGVYYK